MYICVWLIYFIYVNSKVAENESTCGPNATNVDSQPSTSTSTPSATSSNKTIGKRNRKIVSFLDIIQATEKENIDNKLVEAFVACKISFDTLDNEYFKQFMKHLRPAYELPSGINASELINRLDTKWSNSNLAANGKTVVLSICHDDNSLENESVISVISTEKKQHIY